MNKRSLALFLAIFVIGVVPLMLFAADQTNTNLDARGHIIHQPDLSAPEIHRSAPIRSWQATSSAPTQALVKGAAIQSQTQMQAQTATPALGPNLIGNPSFESAGTGGLPTGWAKGGYGTNDRVLTYPSAGNGDQTGARVDITSYTSGDAKWYFNDVPVTPGTTYQFSDHSMSNVETVVDVRYAMSDGTYKYIDIATVAPSSSFAQNTVQFTVPANVVSLTIFHLLDRVGTLSVDDYSLNQVNTSGGGGSGGGGGTSSNLVANGDFEIVGTNGLPVNWLEGSYGSNVRRFDYPVTANGSKAAGVTILNYHSGDAKWYFKPIALAPGTYTYSDSYASNVPTVVDVQLHNADGSYTYKDIAFDPSSSNMTTQSVKFTVPAGTQDVTVFHLIQSRGTLVIDNVVVQQDAAASGGTSVFLTGGVSLTFDDGWSSQYDTAVPILNRYGFKATFYIVSHQLLDYDYSGFMSIANLQSLYGMGDQIGAHTQTHPYLSQLTAAQQWQEINGSRQDLLAMNVGPVDSFAYPYGDYDATTLQLVQQAGFASARSTIDGYVAPDSDHYQLPRQVVVNTTSVSQIEQWIDQAMAQHSWLIFELHRVDTSGDTYSMTPSNFAAVVAYLAQKHVPVITIDQGMQSMQ